jgi:helicase SWR1
MLDNVIIQEGDFTDDYFHKNEWWKDLPEVVGSTTQNTKPVDYEQALLEAEDEYDAAAAIAARKEMNMDENEFQEEAHSGQPSRQSSEIPSRQPSEIPSRQPSEQPDEDDDQDMQLDVGHVDQYMLQFWEREMVGTDLGFGGFPSS